MGATAADSLRALTWSRPGGRGLEHALFHPFTHHADGALIQWEDDGEGAPYRMHYSIRWHHDWRVREALIEVASHRHGARSRKLVRGDAEDAAWRNGDTWERIPLLEGCEDLDLWPSPLTNTFAIRRLGLAIGERREILVAHVVAPRLELRPARQAYTRLASHRYRFESLDPDAGLASELTVDDDGWVLDYAGLFERVRSESPATPDGDEFGGCEPRDHHA